MRILLVYCHPEPKSFTHALLDVARRVIEDQGHDHETSDLYGEGFNPVAGRHDFESVADSAYFHYQSEQALAAKQSAYSAEIEREQARVRRADMMVFLFPIWWGAAPAMMKGWFDRILSYGFAYVDGARFETGLFHGRSAMLCVTTGGTRARFSKDGTYGSIDQVLWPIQQCQLRYLGLDVAAPFVAYAAPRVGTDERQGLLRDWAEALRTRLNFQAGRPAPATLPTACQGLGAQHAWARPAGSDTGE